MKNKTIHGHYSDVFDAEAKRIKKLYEDTLDINITWMEATAIAAERSLSTFWTDKKLKEILAKLRGL